MRVCFYGGPGVGKSTLAAMVFGELRRNGESAELVQEWIKEWAYQGRRSRSFDSVYVLANQLHMEDQLFQVGVETVITDSPLYLQCMYIRLQHLEVDEELLRIAHRFEDVYPSVNFYVERAPGNYEARGRYENLSEARRMDEYILDSLHAWHVDFTVVAPGDVRTVLEVIRERKQ
jgi:hypothetical protein